MATEHRKPGIARSRHLAWLLCIGFSTVVYAGQPVTIDLRQHTVATATTVTVGDVAELRGGTRELRDRIATLDLEQLSSSSQEATVTRAQVKLRCMLAAIEADQIVLTGSMHSRIRYSNQALTDRTVTDALRRELAERWRVPSDSLIIRLTQPLNRSLPSQISFQAGDELRPMLGHDVLPSRTRITFGVYRNDRLVETLAVPLEIQVERVVAYTVHDLPAWHRIAPADVRFERTILVGRDALDAADESLVNQFTTERLRAGRLITRDEISDQSATPSSVMSGLQGRTPNPVEVPEVPRNSHVTLVVRNKNLTIRYAGKLMQRAKVGEEVMVENLAKRQVMGRLISPTVVEVTRR